MKILNNIQAELKAPKNQRNSFGEYNYRSCEDILEALKPLLSKYGAVLTLSDEMVLLGNRYYVKATATLKTPESTFTTSAFAREEETRKKMDASQLTGAASSYARKYALNGLFAIDDTKDADTRDNSEETNLKELSKDKLDLINSCKDKEELIKVCRTLKAELGLSYQVVITKAYKARLAEVEKKAEVKK